MLGRLRMTLDDCLEAYLSLSERIFNPKRSKINALGKAKDFLLANGRFDSDELEIAIKEILKKNGCEETALFQEPDAVCKV